jgi:alcohol dehydrogenase
MISNFVYSQPVKIFFGAGEFGRLSERLRELGLGRCIIVCGRHFAPKAEEMCANTPELVGVFGEVEQNPQLSGVVKTAMLAKEKNADAVIGIGGGSAIDTAKFAAAIALEKADALEYYRGTRPFPQNRLPVIAVPTTAGTGSEVTQVSVISNGSEKKTINNPAFMPTAAIVDPELCLSVPPRTTMNTGLDALAHALEGFWSVNHQPICELMTAEAVRLILGNLENAWRDGSDINARSAMSYAALLGGLAFAQPKTAACHACSYPLSEDYHMPHGEACAFTLDSFVRINADERLEALCRRAGLSGSDELADKIALLKKLGGLRTKLSELGDLDDADMDKLCRDCAAHPLMRNNPVSMDEAALCEMFEALR